MTEISLFNAALALKEPWSVVRTEFLEKEKELHLYIDFPRGSTFQCPKCQSKCPLHDSEDKIWRHLDFFQHKAFLHARVPRSNCKTHGVLTVDLPWARPNSGFSLLFEALVLTLVRSMPVLAIARLVGEHDTLIWRMIHHYVDDARSKVDMSTVRKVGIDETSVQKRHKYLTIFVDIDKSQVLYATPGKDSETLAPFIQDLHGHGGSTDTVREVSIDMSPAFIAGIREYLPEASITFDKFHVTKLVLDAVDKVRRSEQNESKEHYAVLKHSRFALLMNTDRMPDWLSRKLEAIKLSGLNLKSARAWRMKQTFREVYQLKGKAGEKQLRRWCSWAIRSRLEPMKKAARSILDNWSGVVHYFKSNLTNAVLESINAIFQAARAKARGYRNSNYAIAILYLLAGGLDVPHLNKFHTK